MKGSQVRGHCEGARAIAGGFYENLRAAPARPFQMPGVFAEFECSIIQERVRVSARWWVTTPTQGGLLDSENEFWPPLQKLGSKPFLAFIDGCCLAVGTTALRSHPGPQYL
jgi:hypothetical protein